MSHPNLLVGTSTSDDAAVYKINDDLAAVMTVDFFPPIVDDPFTFGEIAAANSLSDIYAMGATAIAGLNVVGFPADLDMNILAKILQGGASKAAEAGIVIAGGHTVVDNEPKYGLSVTGLVKPGMEVTNAGATAGNALILTKPIGTGIITTAGKQGNVSESVLSEAIDVMSQLNKSASEAMTEVGVAACSDVTGFGLMGHLKEMIEGSRVSANISVSDIPVIKGTHELIEKGIAPGGTMRNLDSLSQVTQWEHRVTKNQKILLSDAQTSGGLLIAVDHQKSRRLLDALIVNGVKGASIIGETFESTGSNKIYVSP